MARDRGARLPSEPVHSGAAPIRYPSHSDLPAVSLWPAGPSLTSLPVLSPQSTVGLGRVLRFPAVTGSQPTVPGRRPATLSRGVPGPDCGPRCPELLWETRTQGGRVAPRDIRGP